LGTPELDIIYGIQFDGKGFPYIMGILIPIDRYLPKPGPWMVWIEYAMGVLFMVSAAWLIGWPLSAFLSPSMQTVAWCLLGLWCLIPLMQKWRSIWAPLTQGIVFYAVPLILGIGLFFLPSRHHEWSTFSMEDGNIHLLAWSAQRMQDALQAQRIVVMDVTGKGCALCMVNKRIFRSPAVQEALTKPHVVCLRADYSRGSPEILGLLKQYGRAAIPFNLVISQNYPKGIILSEILTESELLNALKIIQKVHKAPPPSSAR
jgi:suppressor for copper-sensitivity B